MKAKLKDELQNLITGNKGKQACFVVNTYHCNPGYYNHNGKIINTAEYEELKKNYLNTIIFTLPKE